MPELSRLPAYWWRDPAYAAPVQARVRALVRAGLDVDEVARRTGVGTRTVSRYRRAHREANR
jgi:DNA-binding NarL/FixJ family response regulator